MAREGCSEKGNGLTGVEIERNSRFHTDEVPGCHPQEKLIVRFCLQVQAQCLKAEPCVQAIAREMQRTMEAPGSLGVPTKFARAPPPRADDAPWSIRWIGKSLR